MFTTLVESRSARERRGAGTALSVAFHTAVVSLAVYATATAGQRGRPDAPEHVHFVPPVAPAHVPPKPAAPTPVVAVPRVVVPGLDALSKVPDVIPQVDLSKPITDMEGWTRRAAGAPESHVASAAESEAAPYRVTQVDKPAALAPGSAAPSYPTMLREAGITGQVVVDFVVDTLGRVEPGSLHVLQSDNTQFDDAIRAVLPRMRFYPAEAGGHRVRQLVEQPFTFQLTGNR